MSVPKAVKRTVATVKAYKSVFDTPDGRLVLIDLIRRAGVLDGAHEEQDSANFHKNGRRSIVLEILQTLRFDEGGLLELVQARLDEMPDEE